VKKVYRIYETIKGNNIFVMGVPYGEGWEVGGVQKAYVKK